MKLGRRIWGEHGVKPMVILMRRVFESTGDIEKGDIVEAVKLGHQAVYLPFSLEQGGEAHFFVSGVWLCDRQERTYETLVRSESEQVAHELFNAIFDSFICH